MSLVSHREYFRSEGGPSMWRDVAGAFVFFNDMGFDISGGIFILWSGSTPDLPRRAWFCRDAAAEPVPVAPGAIPGPVECLFHFMRMGERFDRGAQKAVETALAAGAEITAMKFNEGVAEVFTREPGAAALLAERAMEDSARDVEQRGRARAAEIARREGGRLAGCLPQAGRRPIGSL